MSIKIRSNASPNITSWPIAVLVDLHSVAAIRWVVGYGVAEHAATPAELRETRGAALHRWKIDVMEDDGEMVARFTKSLSLYTVSE